MTDYAVLIAASELLPTLKARLADDAREVIAFTDSEALRALETITTRRPALVALERRFVSTPRGAALINRIKADPSLADTLIRVVSSENGSTLEPVPAAASPVHPAGELRADASQSQGPSHPEPELDYRGTRRAPRYRIASRDIVVDGNRGTLIDLSTLGAQLVTTNVLKPNQRVRIALSDDAGTIRCSATVVWASFEIPKGQNPRYRAGLDFIEPDLAAVTRYIQRNRQADQQ